MKCLVIVVVHYIIYFVQVMIQAACGKQSPHLLFQGAVEPFYDLSFGFVIGDKMMNVMLFQKCLKSLVLKFGTCIGL